MADMYGYLAKYGNGSGKSMMRNEDLNEEDVWGADEKEQNAENNSMVIKSRDPSSASTLRRLPSASKMIPRAANSSTVHEPKVRQQSAPVNIPDWSKIYNKKSKKGRPWGAADDDEHDDGNFDGHDGYVVVDDDDEDENEDEWVPPHEWIARKLARSKIASFSVCEGAGRTLKGRDLSMVRNAVLSKTGFLE